MPTEPRDSPVPVAHRVLGALVQCAFLAAAAGYAVHEQQPPAPLPADAPPADFSAFRALSHIRAACVTPHPAGTMENDRVRDYIVNCLRGMGLEPELQKTTIVRSEVETPTKPGVVVGDVVNILARIPGTTPTKALMLCAHYDSTQWGPGAADDWAGCAAILETIRALKTGPPLKNDLIFLFSDAEECGLLGAYAFAKEHPWFKDVGLVLNFEARGVGGPSYMFETGPDNGWLIPHFLQAASHPATSSFMADIYLKMPTTSDYKVFKKYGLQGLNCAFIRGLPYYHTKNDSPDNLNLGSLQQHGYYALDVARYFGDLPLENIRKRDAIYFSAVGYWVVHYSGVFVLPLSLLATAVFFAVAALGVARKRLTLSGITKGGLGFLACAVAAPLATALLILIAWSLREEYMLYYNTAYLASVSALVVCIVSTIYIRLRRWVSVEDQAVGAAAWWLVPLAVSTVRFPGASYCFQWPLLFALGGLAWLLFTSESRRRGVITYFVLALSAAPGVLLFVSTLCALNDALTAVLSPLTMIPLVFLLGLLAPHFAILSSPNEWWPPAVSGVAAVVLFMGAFLSHAFSPEQPQLACISYGLNADTGEAVWLSGAEELNEWERQFFPPNPKKGLIADFTPQDRSVYWRAPAPVAALAPAEVAVLSDSLDAAVRTIRFRVSSPRRAPRLDLHLDPKTEVVRAAVNGKPYSTGTRWWMNYRVFRGPDSEIELAVTPADRPVVLTVIEHSPQLPRVLGRDSHALPSYMVAEPNTVQWHRRLRSNTTFVRKSFVFAPPPPM